MTSNYSGQTRALLDLLSRLPARPQITSHGYVDRAVDRVWVINSPAFTITTHSLEIATNNLARPGVAVAVGTNGRDFTPIFQGIPNFSLQEVTYLPDSYFLQHIAHEYNGVTIQVYEGTVPNSQSTGSAITHPLHIWNPALAVLGPTLRTVRERSLPMPESSSDRFLGPIH